MLRAFWVAINLPILVNVFAKLGTNIGIYSALSSRLDLFIKSTTSGSKSIHHDQVCGQWLGKQLPRPCTYGGVDNSHPHDQFLIMSHRSCLSLLLGFSVDQKSQ